MAVLAAVLALGCAGAGAWSRGGAPIRTDRLIYPLNDSGGIARIPIHMSYRNDTGKPVYLPTCQGPIPPRLQKKVGDNKWVVAYAPMVRMCEGAPVMVQPGDIYDYDFQVVAGLPGTSLVPRFSVSEVPGTYRVLWEIFATAERDPSRPTPLRDPLADEQQVSNEFQIKR